MRGKELRCDDEAPASSPRTAWSAPPEAFSTAFGLRFEVKKIEKKETMTALKALKAEIVWSPGAYRLIGL